MIGLLTGNRAGGIYGMRYSPVKRSHVLELSALLLLLIPRDPNLVGELVLLSSSPSVAEPSDVGGIYPRLHTISPVLRWSHKPASTRCFSQVSTFSEWVAILVQGTNTRSIGARTRDVAKIKSCGEVVRIGEGEKDTLTVGGGVDGELPPGLLVLVRGRGDADVIGLLELDESLDPGQPVEAKRRLGSLRSAVVGDRVADSSMLGWRERLEDELDQVLLRQALE